MPKRDTWNRCDYCGRFISMEDFEEGRAQRVCVRLDSIVSGEEYETYHTGCLLGKQLESAPLPNGPHRSPNVDYDNA